MNEEAPNPQKEILKEFSFTRNIPIQKETPQEPNIKDINQDKGNINLSFTLQLHEDNIYFNVNGTKENSKVPYIKYEKSFEIENLKNLNKFFALIENKQIFELIQKSFELNYDEITFSEEKLIIKLMINMMNVLTEEIDFEIPGIKMEKQDEIVILRESVDIMEKERSNFKKEINLLNNTVEELQKKIEEKDIMQQNMIKELKNVIEINKKESKKEIEEEKSAQQNIIKDFKNIVETNKKEFQNKINEILDERKKKEKELLNLIEKQKEEITKLKKTEEYVKENLICQENKEKEKDKCSFIIKLNPIEDSNFKIEINILLFENKIKFIINEIQDELQSNPLIYENYFTLEDFTKDKEDIILRGIGNLKDIFIYIKDIFGNKKKDNCKLNIYRQKKDILNIILIDFLFVVGKKKTLKILEKNVSLKTSLKNIDNSLRKINKDNIENKIKFKQDLLDKVYPVGSYYWSSSNEHPERIFGGTWEKIKGRFIFASDDRHPIGSKGGEEYHTLSIDEIPSHSHNYDRFRYSDTHRLSGAHHGSDYYPYANTDYDYYSSYSTSSVGSGNAHNNMPPYITANCWKRIS